MSYVKQISLSSVPGKVTCSLALIYTSAVTYKKICHMDSKNRMPALRKTCPMLQTKLRCSGPSYEEMSVATDKRQCRD